mgnify:CR=1 FL=1
MTETKYTYSPSVNIIRDLNRSLDYIPTPNAKQVYIQIVNGFKSGTHSFNIVGSYGTGKSSFLLALHQHLNDEKNYFSSLNGSFNGVSGFEFLPVIGNYSSLLSSFALEFGLSGTNYKVEDVLKKIDLRYNSLKQQNRGWLIAIDEFGKYLEYAATHNPEKELYFIQQLAEWANDDTKNILFVTALHQSFNAYSQELTKAQRNEWDKVKGRLKEITFNEPVEQLLLLASERISAKKLDFKPNKSFDKLFTSIEKSKTFPLNNYFDKSIAEKLLPFDILSAAILTSALQRYGQNERSLFQFIDSNDYLGLDDFNNKTSPYFNISCVYDYLMYNYYSTLTTKHNSDYNAWSTIRHSIERAEGELDGFALEAIKIIKTIGLLNIFTEASAIMDRSFLIDYSRLSLGIQNAEETFDKLSTHKIITFTKYDKRFKLLWGTDLDIEEAINEAEIENINNIVPYLNKYFDFPYIQAKEHFYRTGCPRFFQFNITESPFISNVENIDGIINLVFAENDVYEEVIEHSSVSIEPILYCLYQKTKEIKNTLLELERIQYVKKEHADDKIARQELDRMLADNKKALNELVLDGLFSNNNGAPIWIFNGDKISINSQKKLNRQLSVICDWAYPSTPVFRNEMVNKTKLSGAMQPARRSLIKAIVNNFDKPNLDFADEKFPPEKTIYLSLLKNTGIHSGYTLSAPRDKSFMPLWNESLRFLDDAKYTRLNVQVLAERLQKKPFFLKQGFIDFWLPIFLFICRDDYALFDEKGYVSEIDDETLILLSRQPHLFEVKSFDISGLKLELFNSYRAFLDIEETDEVTNESLIQLIKPFLVFYLKLPEYNKKTNRISAKAVRLREAIALSKEPEKTFFEDIPLALGISLEKIANNPLLVKEYIDTLRSLVKEIRTAYEELINRIENFILSEFIGKSVSFIEYKDILKQRFSKLKKHLLLPKQKVFHQRLISELNDRNAWIASIGQSVMGKSLDTISDNEESVLYDNLREMVNELDNLCSLSKSDVNLDAEEIFKIEITSFLKGLQKHTVRFPKEKTKEIKVLETEIRGKLSNDKNLNIALLLQLLQNEINEK